MEAILLLQLQHQQSFNLIGHKAHSKSQHFSIIEICFHALAVPILVLKNGHTAMRLI